MEIRKKLLLTLNMEISVVLIPIDGKVRFSGRETAVSKEVYAAKSTLRLAYLFNQYNREHINNLT
jgi:hypothetical protein